MKNILKVNEKGGLDYYQGERWRNETALRTLKVVVELESGLVTNGTITITEDLEIPNPLLRSPMDWFDRDGKNGLVYFRLKESDLDGVVFLNKEKGLVYSFYKGAKVRFTDQKFSRFRNPCLLSQGRNVKEFFIEVEALKSGRIESDSLVLDVIDQHIENLRESWFLNLKSAYMGETELRWENE